MLRSRVERVKSVPTELTGNKSYQRLACFLITGSMYEFGWVRFASITGAKYLHPYKVTVSDSRQNWIAVYHSESVLARF